MKADQLCSSNLMLRPVLQTLIACDQLTIHEYTVTLWPDTGNQ